jgi:hypothetical protein|tara:strand:- start:626 stop:1027 length:402 start_codon:yes stop_codon:yes gene_type:complete
MAINNFKNIIVHYKDGTSEEDNVNNIMAKELNDFRGWECWAGVQNITISNTGDVYRAICKVGGKLGNIYDGFEMPEETIMCTKPSCVCAADVQLTKALPKHVDRVRIGHESKHSKDAIDDELDSLLKDYKNEK